MKLKKLKTKLRRRKRLPFLVLDLVNIRYLTGFEGSSALLLLTDGKDYFISDSRYQEYASSIIPPEMDFVLIKSRPDREIAKILKREGLDRLFAEEHSATLSRASLLRKAIAPALLCEGGSPVNELRIEKGPEEIDAVRKAVDLADRCFSHLLSIVKPGISEWDISIEIEYFFRQNGSRRTSFDSIVASGAGSSMPHYITSMTRKISKGDVLLIDMGCELDGYNSDLTRTIFINSLDDDLRKIYGVVRRAQELAIEASYPGISCGDLDAVARSHISEAGFGDYFGHSLGHGVGLEVHELPAVKSGGRTRISRDSIITIEPGIYIPGRGGVRIEDVVLVTDNGPEILTKSSKDIHIV